MNQLKIDKYIDKLYLVYIVSLYLFTYQATFNSISNGISVILISLIWIKIIIKKHLIINKFSAFYFLFFVFCFISILFAYEKNLAIVGTQTILSLFLLIFSTINYLDSINKILNLMRYFAVSGAIASIYILLSADFSNITRLGSDLGNVNSVGMMLSISTIFSYYFILCLKEYKFLIIMILNFSLVLLTGSRQSLVFLVFSLLLVMIFSNKKRFTVMLKKLLLSLVVIIFIFYIIQIIPIFRDTIGVRMESWLNFTDNSSNTDNSLLTRFYMAEMGWNWFMDRPLTGYGLNNYRVLLENAIGLRTYSHNNFIELLIGIGFFGTITFYYSNFLIVIDLLKESKDGHKILIFTIISIIIGFSFMSISTIYYYNKHFSLILAMGSSLSILIRKQKKSYAHNMKSNFNIKT